MRIILLVFSIWMLTLSVNAQIAVSTDGSTPHASAMLEVKTNNKGFLLPRLTATQKNAIASPATGLMIYETTSDAVWVYNGEAWVQLGSGGGSSPWTISGSNIYNSNTGNIGIGHSSISEKFDVNGNIRLTGSSRLLRFETAQAGTSGQFIVSRYAPGIQFIRSNGDLLGKIEYVDTLEFANFLRFYTGPSITNALTINTDNFVGIGTQNPQVKMQVVGAGEIFRLHSVTDPLMQFTTGLVANGIKKGFLDINGNDFRIGTNAGNDDGKFIVRVNGTDVVNVLPNSNVGIGTATPAAKLHVVGTIRANNNGEVLRIDGNNPVINFYQNGVFKSFLSHSSNGLYMGVNNGDIRLDVTGGQVAIGNVIAAASDYKLAVQGRVICEELKVKLSGNWPDYVFSKNYRLLPLSELASYIDQNHHLPNIPAAKTIESEGLVVGEMQKKMMEKIEELTLYIIDLQKQIDQLKANAKQ